MESELITPQSRALYHGASPGPGRGRQLLLSLSPPRIGSGVTAGRLLLAACSEAHSFPAEPQRPGRRY